MKTQSCMVRPAEGKPVMIDGGTPLRIVADLIRKAGGVLIRWPADQREVSETLLLEYRGKAVLTPFGLMGRTNENRKTSHVPYIEQDAR